VVTQKATGGSEIQRKGALKRRTLVALLWWKGLYVEKGLGMNLEVRCKSMGGWNVKASFRDFE